MPSSLEKPYLTACLLFWIMQYATSYAHNNLVLEIDSGYNFHTATIAPLYHAADELVYLALVASYAAPANLTYGAGIGYRIRNDDHIIGSYLILDHSQEKHRYYFNAANLGLEYLGHSWDLHLNAYQPLGKKQWLVNTGWASDYGNFNYTTFKQHEQYDHLFYYYQQLGTGADINIVWHPIQDSHIALGAYHFNFNPDNLNGVAIRFEKRFAHNIAATVTEQYDNFHHQRTLLGLKYYFDEPSQTLTHRLQTPLLRQIATAGKAIAMPVITQRYDPGHSYLARQNIWFFDRHVSSHNLSDNNQCTAEHPCQQFNQKMLDSINNTHAAANIYLAPGQYSVTSLALNHGETIYGRSNRFIQPSNQAVLNGTITLASHSSLNDLTIVTPDTIGINIDHAQQVRLNNVKIGAGDSSNTPAEAIRITNSTDVIINNSEIRAVDNEHVNDLVDARAISIVNSDVNIKNSLVSAKAEATTSVARAAAITNITSQKVTQVRVHNSQLFATATSIHAPAYSQVLENNVFNQGSSLAIVNTSLTAMAKSRSNTATAIGLWNFAHEGALAEITFATTKLNAFAKANQSTTIGIKNGGELFSKSIFRLKDSAITTLAYSRQALGNSIGLQTDPAFNAQADYFIKQTQMNVSATSEHGIATAIGIQSLPYFAGKNSFAISNSEIAAFANSQQTSAIAMAIDTSDSAFILKNNHLVISAASPYGETEAIRIHDQGGNTINETNHL